MYMLRKQKTKGQVLLLALMAMAVLTTIVGTSVLRSTVTTRTERQNEATTQAENAAKGLQEAQLGGGPTIPPSNFEGVDSGKSSQNSTPTSTGSFVSPYVVSKDGQYVFYMSSYNIANNTFGIDYYTGNIDILYDDPTTGCPVLEVILIDNLNNSTRAFSKSPSGCDSNAITFLGPSATVISSAAGESLMQGGETTPFNKRITISAGLTTKLIIVRPYFAGTKLGIKGMGLKPQGREISSTIRTVDGVQKTEKTYQLYPQIPLNLFATIF